MKGEYDDIEDNDEFQFAGLGAGRKNKMSKNQQIYGDFYQAYEEQPKPNQKKAYSKSYGGAYNRFKVGSTIQNYAAQCDVHIPEPKPKKKIKTQEIQEEEQKPEIGQFNLQSFLRNFQQKEELEKIEEESEQDSYNGPFCLHSKVKTNLKLVKIGEEEDFSDLQDPELMNINEMTFEQYKKLVMKNGKKEEKSTKKKLTSQEKQKQKEFIESYGKGYSMLEKMGFNLTKGLGKDEKGITKPVEAVFKTAFTTKDSELKEEEPKEDEAQTQEQEIAAETALFQYRSRNIKINNFLLDLKNKFESLTSKMYFYEREVENFDRDFEINQSLKLQKQNQIQQHDQEINKLSSIREFGKIMYENKNIVHNQELNLKHIFPHLALKYKMDLLSVKNQYLRLKSMNQTALFEAFPQMIRQINRFLNNFYLEKERETVKGYQEGLKNFKDKQSKVVNLDEDVIDLVDERPTEPETVVTVSIEDQQKITKMIELIAQNTVISKINQIFFTYIQIEDIKNLKILECLRVLKELNKNSELVQTLINQKIKPLIFKYYNSFDCQQIFPVKKDGKELAKQQISQQLPHLIIFPLFQIMDPAEFELGKLLKVLSKKLWNLRSPTLLNILKPILQYCSIKQKQHFINFYLTPRFLYHLEEFDLTQPHICKDLMSSLKLYKEILPLDILKDLLNCTIIPEIVMTYRKYKEEGTGEKDLSQWTERWVKEIGKIVPNHLQEVLINDFNIEL